MEKGASGGERRVTTPKELSGSPVVDRLPKLKEARRAFRIGDVVRPTRDAYDAGVFPRNRIQLLLGTVIGFGRTKWSVRVLLPHRRTASDYAAHFWIRIPTTVLKEMGWESARSRIRETAHAR